MHDLPWKLVLPCIVLVALLPAAAPSPAMRADPNRFAGTALTGSVGENIEVHFTNPGLANQTVTVIASNDDGDEIPIQIKLDEKGKGKASFTLPNWDILSLDHPTSESHVIGIY